MCALLYIGAYILSLRSFRFELVKIARVPVFKSKTRMVSFRLSEEEFRSFKNVRTSGNYGSFSELIRAAVQELIANRRGYGGEALRAAMERLNARIEEV